jgi:hypothetical protein
MVAFQDGWWAARGSRSATPSSAFGQGGGPLGCRNCRQLVDLGKLDADDLSTSQKVTRWTTAACWAAPRDVDHEPNLIPVHIAFIPLLIPPLLIIANAALDRRAVPAC